jgi:hypothetical protein
MLSIHDLRFHGELTQITPSVVIGAAKIGQIATEVLRLLASRFYVFPYAERWKQGL